MVSSESQSRVCAPKTCKQLKEQALSILRVQRQRGHKVSGSNPKYYCKVMSIKNFLNKCLLLVTQLCPTLRPHGLQHARLPCPLLSLSLFKLMSIESMMLSKHLNLCHPLLLLPSISPSIRVFSNESALRTAYIYWVHLRARSCSKHFTCIISLNLCKNARQ